MNENLNIETVDGWKLALLSENDERRVRDVDLGERLRINPPRMIRKLIKRHLSSLKKLGEIVMRDTVERIEKRGAIKGFEERTVKEYWLNKDQALYVTMHSGTKMAGDVSVSLIQAYNKLRTAVAKQQAEIDELRRELQRQRASSEMVSRVVRSLPASRGPQWKQTVIGVLAGWLKQPNQNSLGGVPVWTGSVTGRLMRMRFGKELFEAIKDAALKHDDVRLHELMSDEGIDALSELQRMIVMLGIEHSDYKDALGALQSQIDYLLGLGAQLPLFRDGSCGCGRKFASSDAFCSRCGNKRVAQPHDLLHLPRPGSRRDRSALQRHSAGLPRLRCRALAVATAAHERQAPRRQGAEFL